METSEEKKRRDKSRNIRRTKIEIMEQWMVEIPRMERFISLIGTGTKEEQQMNRNAILAWTYSFRPSGYYRYSSFPNT